MGTPYKKCPRCHAPAHLETETCIQCGHKYRTRFVPSADQTQVYGLEEKQGLVQRLRGDGASRPLAVSLMWIFVLMGVSFWKISFETAAVANVCAILLAIWLTSSRSRFDRICGGVMLLIQCVAVAVFCWQSLSKGK